MSEIEIEKEMNRYKYYHIIQLTDSIATPGYTDFVPAQDLCLNYLKSLDLKGKRVLDIGCRDGLYSFAAESAGASEVIGIDNHLSEAATEFLIPFFKSKIKMEEMNLYDLTPNSFGLFDLVIFPGVLYHLRYPFWGLRVLRDVLKVGGHLVIETPIWRGNRNNAMLFCPTEDDSPYESTSCTFFNEKGLVDTLKSMGFDFVMVDYLTRRGLRGFKDHLRRVKERLGVFLSGGSGPSVKNVTRSVLHFTLGDYDKQSWDIRYWESTHDFHHKQNPEDSPS
jgi:SAM-dependent methyltransferase